MGNERGVFFNISPDKSKIIYTSYESDLLDSSIFIADIKGDTIINRKCLYPKSVSYGGISISSWWAKDSKTFLIDEKESGDSWVFDQLRLYEMPEKKVD